MAHYATYPPLDTLKKMADDVWIVDSGPHRMMGLPLPVRMTVLRDTAGGLLLHSPTRFTPRLLQELQEIGTFRYLLAPNSAHWAYVHEWIWHCPDAVPLAVPALLRRKAVRESGIRFIEIKDGAIDGFAGTEVIIVRAGKAFQEAALIHRPSRTLVLTDLVVNVEARKLPILLRPGARIAGVLAPNGRAPIYLRLFVLRHRDQARPAVQRILALDPERVIFSHGLCFDRWAAEPLRRSLNWLAG